MPKTITLPAQPEFSRRTFAGQGGQDVPVYGYAFVMEDVHYRGESIGDHARDALKKAMADGTALTIDDKDMEWNDRFNVYKIKMAKEGGGGGYAGKGGGGGWGKPRYSGKKLTGKEWVTTTMAVFNNIYAEMLTICEPVAQQSAVITEARALAAQFWICVEQGVIELAPAPAGQAAASAPRQPELPGAGKPDALHEAAALVVLSQKIANAARQDEVIGIEAQVAAHPDLTAEDKATLKRQAMQRKKSLAQRAAEDSPGKQDDIPF